MSDTSSDLPRILLAEDDHTIAYIVQRVLEDQQRFQVTWVKDGEAALEAAEANVPDLFLLDLMMPRRNGFEVCRRLRADARFKDRPICILTALTDPQAHQAALDAGANLLLLKPFRSSQLREAVRDLLSSPSQARDPAAPAQAPLLVPNLSNLLKLVAHDMRGPLTVFNSSLSFLENTHDPAERQELIESLQDASQRLTAMVDNVISSCEQEELENMPRDARVDLCALTRATLSQCRVAFNAREVEVEQQIPDLPMECIGNESLLRSALSNALLNAADYSPLGGKVRVVVARDRSECCISISDEGPGIGAEVVDELFEIKDLVTLKSKGIRVGKGLGLVLVRRICNLHQGYVDVRTGSIGGTDLTLGFPLAKRSDDANRSGVHMELRVPIRVGMVLKRDNATIEVFTQELGRERALIEASGVTIHGMFDVRFTEFPAVFARARVGDGQGGMRELVWVDVNPGFSEMLDQIYRTVPGGNLLG